MALRYTAAAKRIQNAQQNTLFNQGVDIQCTI